MTPNVAAFFDAPTSSLSYIVSEPNGPAAVIIDPVLNYDAASGRTSTGSADELIAHVRQNGLEVGWILDTHTHADHMTAMDYLEEKLGAPTGIGAGVARVQQNFVNLYDIAGEVAPDGSQFDYLFADGDVFPVGAMEARVMAVPGHTPGCVAYVIGDAAFIGDTLFMPDSGTARCDFPDGDAAMLYRSIRRLLDLPVETRLYVCHDYQPEGRDLAYMATVGEHRRTNIHINDTVDEAGFVAMRRERDATLSAPALILPAVQVNIRAGRFPEPCGNGTRYLKIPLNTF
jgi:glyoxylase-like metal-dependent hydrolase (beta-lactamase superfamily II)